MDQPSAHNGIFLLRADSKFDLTNKSQCNEPNTAYLLKTIGINSSADIPLNQIIATVQLEACESNKNNYIWKFKNPQKIKPIHIQTNHTIQHVTTPLKIEKEP
jgi:PIN domain nuclease of toxin-antitoxin system